ncbi:von Willebrand factor A domain-containing protein 8 [Ischnura elegans]|uniref:von Willebrand factor A domain-containing protein 8 n=1 Tax=Ischnura elegans TaxID=197161 RepID=UPI001ED8BA9A|nr:von Willebrand factor A domain-containing protein 8 [Ischnura elegans]
MGFNLVQRRVGVLLRVLSSSRSKALRLNFVATQRYESSDVTVSIGDVSKTVRKPDHPQYVPSKYLPEVLSQELLQHLHWMLQKDILGQDIFLIGRPGPLRRKITMQYLQMTKREVEYVSLSRDTTESDLKQRREITKGTSNYFDQCAVRAAVQGRVLVLEGIEKVERNVLPLLNNLLENREMHLEDGRFLVPAARYDKLLQEHTKEELDSWKLIRVDDDFRVIALGLPVPQYLGNPLDPPLRSRFQARDIKEKSFKEQFDSLRDLCPNLDEARLSQLLSTAYALLSPESASLSLPDFPTDALPAAAKLLETFPKMSVYDVICRLYPYKCFLNQEGKNAVEDILKTFEVLGSNDMGIRSSVKSITPSAGGARVDIECGGQTSAIEIPMGNVPPLSSKEVFVSTPYQEQLLAELIQSHMLGDICLVGPKGSGKSATISRLANMLGYVVEPIILYQDMTSRDLIQQRTTLESGDTVWQHSPLVTAALEGKLAVLDGIHRIHPSTLAVVHRLVHDRELHLYDGQRLLRHDRYDEIKKENNLSDESMVKSGVLRIHPSFRIIALADPPVIGGSTGQWLSPELLSLFTYHEMRALSLLEELSIIESLYGKIDPAMKKVLDITHRLRSSADPTVKSLSGSLSTRQLLRIARRMALYPSDSVYDIIHRACLSRFLPSLAQQALNRELEDFDLRAPDKRSIKEADFPVANLTEDHITIGKTTVPRYDPKNKTKVPDVLFYDVPQHMQKLEWLLQDFQLGEHLLLVGNQGVGKNKLVDRMLYLLNRPREYIQLHRDTTVQTLTTQPTVQGGILVYEDSPLVQAVKWGHVLVVDEADKAPTHVTCILKTLVESGEMILSDGRRIVRKSDPRALSGDPRIIPLHDDFRMIVLANRPGFPFLGNDFFGALGDLFSCHAVDNPSKESEIALLKNYGPDVPEEIIHKLVKAFGELRDLADQGLVSYPYSTREVVNIVRHLQKFPEEPLGNVVRNVFDFDSYNKESKELLVKTLHKHGIPVGAKPSSIYLGKELPLPKVQLAGKWMAHVGPRSPLKTHDLMLQENFFKLKDLKSVTPQVHLLDKTEARSAFFSELQSYWTLPMKESNIIAALTVDKDTTNNQMKDTIHVLLANPVSLMSMVPSGDSISELPLQRYFSVPRGVYPRFTMSPLGKDLKGCLAVHEEHSNTLLIVDPPVGVVKKVPLPTNASLFEDAKGLAKSFLGSSLYKDRERWSFQAGMMDQNWGVLYRVGGNHIEMINIESLSSYSFTVPFELSSIHLVGPHSWLVEATDGTKYTLERKNDNVPCANHLIYLDETKSKDDLSMGPINQCESQPMDKFVLSSALGNQIDSPNRLLSTDNTYAAIVVGFPELKHSENDVYLWPKPTVETFEQQQSNRTPVQNLSVLLKDCGQIVRCLPGWKAPKEALPENDENKRSGIAAFLEVTDVMSHKLRYIPIPEPANVSPYLAFLYGSTDTSVLVAGTSGNGVVSLDAGGSIRLWETGLSNLELSLKAWRKNIGSGQSNLQMTIDSHSGKDVSSPKFGKVDPTGAPHVGGNTWAGGTGGRDTAGLGGKGGPYRLDAGHDVHQLSDEEKAQVPEHVRRAAREMAQKAFKERLKEIKMSEYDGKLYEQFSSGVSKQVKSLRVILSNLQAKSKERQWVRHQTTGEMDDTKLIEGLTGEKTIYRRRAEKEPEMGAPQQKPKRLKIVVDVSGSMYRFNSYDARLDRIMEASILVMEAFEGYESKFKYDIVGHSGESYDLTFVDHKNPPRNNKERLDVIKTMHAHSQFCMSGDHTLEATKHAVSTLATEDCDESFVLVLSDANLERYGIPPQRFGTALTGTPSVNAYAVFIGSLGDQADRLKMQLPAGRAFVCLDLKELPQILQQIFASSVLSSR